MEVKALVEVKGVIKFNREEIEDSLKRIEAKYQSLVLTEEEVPLGKDERAKLNKLVKDLATYRKNVVEDFSTPINEFETSMKETEKRVKKVSDYIDLQIKLFEEEQKNKRLEKVKEYLNKKFEENPKYKEFENMFVLSDSIYTNKGSYGTTGNIGMKLSEHLTSIFNQIDEILAGREAAAKLLQEKRELVVSTCKSTSEMLGLEIHLDPKNFAYLKDYELQEIILEIQETGNRAKKQQDDKLEEIKKREYEKAQKELEKKEVEVKKEEIAPTPKAEEKTEVKQEKVEILEVSKQEKLFYAEFSIDGIPVQLARELSAWLKSNNVKYTVKSQEVK